MKKILFVQTNYPGFLDAFQAKLKPGMSYEQIKRLWDGEWFGQGNFYSKNLPSGYKGEEIILNSWPMQSQWAKENKVSVRQQNLPFLNKLPESVKNFLGLRQWMKTIFFAQVKKIKPSVIYMHDLSVLNSDDIKYLKKYTKLVAGQIACPLPLNREPLTQYDLIVSSFPHYVKIFRSWGINSEYLPWCFEKTIVGQFKSTKKKYDVTFIGGYSTAHSGGNRLLEMVAKKVKIDFWGYGIAGLPISSPIRKTYHAEVWGRDMYRVMAESKIVLNRHIDVAGNVANNMRMFDVTGVGSLLISDNKPNMEEFFKVGKEVVVYKSVTDLTRKVKYYTDHPGEASRIARAGQMRTLKSHNYKVRMSQLAKILGKYL